MDPTSVVWAESVSDVPLLAEGGVNQDEPEVGLIRVQRDTARSTVRVVVWMREDTREGSVAHSAQYRFRDLIAATGMHLRCDRATIR